MTHTFRFAFVLFIVFLATESYAQSARPESLRDMLLGKWNEIGEKVTALAEEFPEDKYDFRPVPGVRTFAEQLRHVAFWNLFVAKTARGEKIDPAINELSKSEYPTKASIVAILKQTVADGAAELKKRDGTPPLRDTDLWVTFIEHSGEHYGQMVVYFRLNGLVPPASR
jgi:hypothetical protein